jgi:outer membrane protein
LRTGCAATGLALAFGIVSSTAAQAPPRRLGLAEAIESALQTHETIASAGAGRRTAEIAEWRAWTAVAPSVDVGGSYTREKDEIAFPAGLSVPGGFNPVILQREASRGAFTVTQPIVSPQFWPLRDLGRAGREKGDQGVRQARQDVALAVAEAYYGVLRAGALVRVSQESERLAAMEAEHARAKVEQGDAVASDVLRARTEIARVRQRLVEADGALESARRRLARLASIEGEFEIEEPVDPAIDLGSPEPFVASAMQQNPTLKQAELDLEAAKAEERRRRAALYPTVDVRAQYRLVDSSSFAERNDFWEVVAGVKIPLFQGGGSALLDLAEQKARVARIEAEVRGLRRDVELGVHEAYVAARTLTEREKAAIEEESLAVESHRLISEQYEAGAATSVEMLAALTARDSAGAARATVGYDRRLALLRLEHAAGALGEVPPPPAARPAAR